MRTDGVSPVLRCRCGARAHFTRDDDESTRFWCPKCDHKFLAVLVGSEADFPGWTDAS